MGNTERDRLFERADQLGWVASPPNKKGYIKLLCPKKCGKHKMWVHKTPSDPYYYNQRIKFLERQKCD